MGDHDHSIVLISPTHLPQIEHKAHRLEVDGVPHVATFELLNEGDVPTIELVRLLETDQKGENPRAILEDAGLLEEVASVLAEHWRKA